MSSSPQPDAKDFVYTGTDNLEVMAEARNYNAYLGRLVERHVQGARRIVDFGAGIGTFALPLQSPDREVIAIELDAAQRLSMQEKGLNCVAGIDAIADDWADAIYSMNVLEHIEDDVAALRSLQQKMKPGGRLLIYVPAFQCLYSAMDRKVGHFRRYRKADLCAKIEQAGFQVREARHVDSLGFLATLAYQWFGSRQGDLDRNALIAYDRLVFPPSRAIDMIASRFLGKNLWVVARKA